MNHEELTYQLLADLAKVHVDTVRDLITGRRWPRPGKQWQIEDALGWERGRIAALARDGELEMAGGAPEAEADSDLLLDLSVLPAGDRHRMWALYYDLVEKQRDRRAM